MLYVTDIVTRKPVGVLSSQRYIIEADTPEQAKNKIILKYTHMHEAGLEWFKGKSIVVIPVNSDIFGLSFIGVQRSILKEQNIWKF